MKNSAIIFIAFLLLQSCSPFLYIPSPSNTPLLQEKNEIKANLNWKSQQIGYALTDHIGLIASNKFQNRSSGNDTSFYTRHGGYLTEIGAGYFGQLNEHTIHEYFAGVGYGRTTFEGDYSDAISSTGPQIHSYQFNTLKFFVQPEVGWVNEYFETGISSRFTFLKPMNLETQKMSSNKKAFYGLDSLTMKTWVYWEPSVTLRGGYKYVKFQFQPLLSLKLNRNTLYYWPFNFNFGVTVNLAKWYK